MAVLTAAQKSRILAELTGTFADANANLSQFVNDEGFVQVGAPITAFSNTAGYLVPGDNVSALLNDASYLASGDNVSALVNDANYLASGANVSELTNDAGYITNRLIMTMEELAAVATGSHTLAHVPSGDVLVFLAGVPLASTLYSVTGADVTFTPAVTGAVIFYYGRNP